MPTPASPDQVTAGMLVETTEGTFETSAAFRTQLTDGITPEAVSNTLEDTTVSGEGEPLDKRTNYAAANIGVPFKVRYFDNRDLVSAALRAAFPAPVTIVGTSDLNVVLDGTHQDGSTGDQITGPANAFDALINYDGATVSTHPAGGGEGLMMILEGWANADNNRPRRIKAVWDDSGTATIDIADAYTTGAAGVFGAPMVAETLVSATIRVGSAVRNKLNAANSGSYSWLWNLGDVGKWQHAFGQAANDLQLSLAGKEAVQGEIDFVGYGAGPLVDTDPSGQGFDDAHLQRNQFLAGGKDLLHFSIIPKTSGAAINLACHNLTGFSYSVAGNTSVIDDGSGCDEATGVVRGRHDPSGSFDYWVADSAIANSISALGTPATRQKAGIDVVFQDPDGNWLIWGFLENEFEQSIPAGEGERVEATQNFAGHQASGTSRSFVWQEIPAP